MSEETTKNEHPLRRLWVYADGYHGQIATATTYSVLNKLFDLAPPILIGMAVDVVVSQEDSLTGPTRHHRCYRPIGGIGDTNLRRLGSLNPSFSTFTKSPGVTWPRRCSMNCEPTHTATWKG